MVQQKKFLLFAIIVGLAGVVIGTITMYSAIEDLFKP
jgi:hypothetical protein